MKLGTMLLRDAVISLGQLEDALRAQVIYGGRLGTNLIELGHIDVDTLGVYLSRSLKLPIASKERFEQVERRILREFGVELADLYTAFPLGWERNLPGTLGVAMADPKDQNAVEQLTKQCGHPIAPYVTPELRLFYYLEFHYQIVRQARFVRTGGDPERAKFATSDRRRAQPAGGMITPEAVTFAPKKPSWIRRAASVANDPEVTYREVMSMLEEATSRDQIADAIVEYAIGRFGLTAVLLIRDGNANGWRSYSATGVASQKDLDRMSLPLGGASVLQAAYDSQKPFRGQSPSAGRPIERELWKALKLDEEPDDLLVVPILVDDKVVNLVYVHGLDGAPVAEHQQSQLIELASCATAAYERLLTVAADDS